MARGLWVATVVAVGVGCGAVGLEAQRPDAAGVAARYLELTFDRRYDALLELYASDAVFSDPTAEVFGDPELAGPVVGASAIVALQKGWGLDRVEFHEDVGFTVGQYSVHRGTLTVGYAGSDAEVALPFATVLRIVDGRVAERIDHAEYVESFGLDGFEDTTETTRRVAGRYLQAYLDADLDTQRELLAPDVDFQDPTAQVYGPGSGQPIRGAEALLARRARTFANVAEFGLDVERSFVSNHHAVYMGMTRYTLANGQRFAQPAVFVVEVRDGKVTAHRDYVDYSRGPVD